MQRCCSRHMKGLPFWSKVEYKRVKVWTSGWNIPIQNFVKGATSQFEHLEEFSLNVLSSSFVIRVNLLHP